MWPLEALLEAGRPAGKSEIGWRTSAVRPGLGPAWPGAEKIYQGPWLVGWLAGGELRGPRTRCAVAAQAFEQ